MWLAMALAGIYGIYLTISSIFANFAIAFMSAFTIGLFPIITTAVFIIAGWSLGFMFYEFALNYVTIGKFTNPTKITYHIGGKDILRPSTWIWRKLLFNKFPQYEAFPILFPLFSFIILLTFFIFIIIL